MGEAGVVLSGEINLGQLMVVGSIVASAVGIYLKSKLDMQRLDLQSSGFANRFVTVETEVKALAVGQQRIEIQLAALGASHMMTARVNYSPEQLADMARHPRHAAE